MSDESLIFNQTLKKLELVFRCAGINIKSTEIKSNDWIKSRTIYIMNFLWLNMDLAGGIYGVIDGVRTGKDFLSLTYIAPCLIHSTLSDTKSLLLCLNEKHVHKLIDNLRNMEKNAKKRELTIEEEAIIKTEKDFLNIVITVIKWLYGILVTLLSLSPIVIMSFKYFNTSELELILPFLILYPFDPFQLKVWPFVYLHQVWTACVGVLGVLTADCFFFTCCTSIRVQFKLLQHNIDNIVMPIQITTNLSSPINDEFNAKFKQLVRWHQDLIKLVQILETIYSKSTLLNLLCSSMIICLAGFNVTVMINDIVFVVTFLTFLAMGLFQVFVLNLFADLLTSASIEISDAVYKTQWYMAEGNVGKNLSIMQIRGQNPCKFTVYGFANVNLNTFMRVLSTAWSYFALLQTIYGS